MKKFNIKISGLVMVLMLLVTMVLPGTAQGVQAGPADVRRLHGASRVETSINVSQDTYKKGSAETVVLAGYRGEVDALTGTILASLNDAPLLLANEKSFEEIKAELTRLSAKKVILLGDTGVLSAPLENKLEDLKLDVSRVSGGDRFDTAIEVAKEAGETHEHIFLTNDGRSGELADALAIGPVSGKNQDPILLTSKSKLPTQTAQAIEDLGVKRVTIIGGEVAVSDAVKKELENSKIKVERVSGQNRWETATKIATDYFEASDKVILANDGRKSYADALIGGYLGAKHEAPILLTQAEKHQSDEALNKYTKKYLEDKAVSAYVLGGKGVISTDVLTSVKEILKEKNKEESTKEADLTKYKEALTAVKEADYTDESWATYQKVVEKNKVTENDTQDDVNAAIVNILAAQKALVKKQEPKPEPTKTYITLSIDKETIDKGYVFGPEKVEITEGESVWDVTKRVMTEEGISYEASESSQYGSVYVESIAGDGEFDHGPGSGWMYSVDGTYPNFGASVVKVTDGQTIKWSYTTNLGEDLGSSIN